MTNDYVSGKGILFGTNGGGIKEEIIVVDLSKSSNI